MDYTEILTKYTGNFVDELAQSGLRNVVISPGSRSTPLAMMFAEHEQIKDWVIIDERSAAFFALGIAKESMKPVALLCTSGTAAANYYPAVVEAYYSRIPIIVLTADRPHELRDSGASQTINQINMYGDYIKWFHDMALPEASEQSLSYVRSKASRVIYEACSGNKGPVHLNFPFREPLVPDFNVTDFWGKRNERRPYHAMMSGEKKLSVTDLEKLAASINGYKKGVIVCGPQVDQQLASAIVKLAAAWNIPVLADPLSQLRAGSHSKEQIIEGFDAILRYPAIRNRLKPDYIIRFGAMPISKNYLFYVKEMQNVQQFVVEVHSGSRDPAGNATQFIYSDPVTLCDDLRNHSSATDNLNREWLAEWQQLNQSAKKHLMNQMDDQGELTEGEAVKCLFEAIPMHSCLFVGNSMAIRDVDTFFMATEKNISIHANRGASGIDGVVSSALGTAASATKAATLIIGDLSFYHDLNGLLTAKQYDLNLTILLLNNNGGGIFSFLPQAKHERNFEKLFGTPLHIDFEQAINMYDGKYSVADTPEKLKRLLALSYAQSGLSVIEVKTDRNANVQWHRDKWSRIEKELFKNES
ncbi:2-succinyl-5-enolpyruvyl-6-hydroxy-3-cyclohexene-1-carboxylic-acid synthase [Virgibacillus sp. W0430]|uniref:2-succinyl-5-enolpyruvyl-6-hydroxy-3- cyclohexene-1-carboxylic-acid synthase n=1 Tax=Virgibacillus sp. W0430 TaxID=3391580 RepID=UPI003F4650C6